MTLVTVDTELGSFTLSLDAEKAPKTVENLLRYVDSKHYDRTLFHRVIAGFMAQGGGYDTLFQKRPAGAPVENEAHNGLENVRGTVAMARTADPHSATAQFFVNVTDNVFLNHSAQKSGGFGYTVFGTVTAGMDVVDRIVSVAAGAKGPFSKDAPLDDVVLRTVRRG